MAFQQDSIGPGFQALVVAAEEMDQPQPEPQDRINIPASGRVKGSMETEACQFPPSHTPQSYPSPALPPYSPHVQLPPQLSTHGQHRGPMDYYQVHPPSYHQRPPQPQYVPGHPQRYPPQPQPGPATGYFYPPAQTYQPIPRAPYARMQPAPTPPQQGPYAPAQPAPTPPQQGPYAPAQPAPHRQKGPYAPAQPAPHRQQGPYARVHVVPPAPVQEQEQSGPELANDPLYQCIRSQMMGQSQKDCCKGCVPTGLARMSTLSYKMKEVITFFIPKRRGTPAESPLLRKAFITGWAMLSSFMFPLVSRHGLRCLWSCGQMVFAIVLVVLSFAVGTQYVDLQLNDNTEPIHALIRNWFGILASILAVLDSVVCLAVLGKKLCGTQNLAQEQQPLLHNNNNNRFVSFCKSYNDVLRLVIAEIILYGILILSLPLTFDELHGRPFHVNSSEGLGNQTVVKFVNTDKLAHLKFSMFILTAVTFAIFVYLPQSLVLGKIFLIRNQLRPKSPTRRIAGWWFVQLLLQFIGQRVVQIVMLTTFVTAQMNSHKDEINPDLLYIIIIAYFAPVVGILTFLIVGYGWMEDLSILHCTDYLTKLDQIRSNAQTPQTTKQAIEEVLAHFELRNLLGGMGQITLDHFFRNCKYILQSPLAFLLSLPNIACIILYLYALYHYASMLAIAWLVLQPFLILFVNLYTFFVSLILVVYLIFLPLAGPVIFCRICKRAMDHY